MTDLVWAITHRRPAPMAPLVLARFRSKLAAQERLDKVVSRYTDHVLNDFGRPAQLRELNYIDANLSIAAYRPDGRLHIP